MQLAAITQADTKIDAQVTELRQRESLTGGEALDSKLLEAASEIRLRKDEWEVAEIQKAIERHPLGLR